jgi:hypothetical protein
MGVGKIMPGIVTAIVMHKNRALKIERHKDLSMLLSFPSHNRGLGTCGDQLATLPHGVGIESFSPSGQIPD